MPIKLSAFIHEIILQVFLHPCKYCFCGLQVDHLELRKLNDSLYNYVQTIIPQVLSYKPCRGLLWCLPKYKVECYTCISQCTMVSACLHRLVRISWPVLGSGEEIDQSRFLAETSKHRVESRDAAFTHLRLP